MEESLIKVKDEPIDNDDHEYEELLQEQQETLLAAATASLPPLKTEIVSENELIIKTEITSDTEDISEKETYSTALGIERMEIVEEQADIITVNAVENKSEDEKKFMLDCMAKEKSARRRKQVFFNRTCEECQQTFNTRRSYEQHSEYGLCNMLETTQRCPVCPMLFTTQALLDNHLAIHRLNRFFCSKCCGEYFDTLEECKLHEYHFHQARSIKCSVCNHKFNSGSGLTEHMKKHSALKRFVCSFCRDWFSCSIDLAKHWQVRDDSCGKLMQDIVRNTMMAIESTLPIFSETASSVDAVRINKPTEPPKNRSRKTPKSLPSVEKSDLKGHAVRDDKLTEPHENLSRKVSESQTFQKESELKGDAVRNDKPTEPPKILFIKVPESQSSKELKLDAKRNEKPTEPPEKRFKTMPESQPSKEEISIEESPSELFIPSNDVKIKEEPYDSEDQQTDASYLELRNECLAGSSVIKSEVEDDAFDEFKIKSEPIWDEGEHEGQSKMSSSNSEEKEPPINQEMPNVLYLRDFVNVPKISTTENTPVLCAKSTLPSLPNLKVVRLESVPTFTSTINVKPLQLQNQNVKLPTHINLAGCKILKIMPGTKFMRLPANAVVSTTTTTTTDGDSRNSRTSEPIVLKFKSPSQQNNCATTPLFGIPMNNITTVFGTVAESKQSASFTDEVMAKISVENVTTAQRRINCKSKYELQMIESLPQKRAIIDNMKEEIKKFVEPEKPPGSDEAGNFKNTVVAKTPQPPAIVDGSTSIEKVDDNADANNGGGDDDEESQGGSLIIDEDLDSKSSFGTSTENHEPSTDEQAEMAARSTADVPPTFFIPVVSDCEPELQAARKRYRDYRYQWKCPRCPRKYGQKYSFRGHLVSAHGYCKEEYSQLIVEVKAVPITRSLEELNLLSNKTQQLRQSHSESENDSNDRNSSTEQQQNKLSGDETGKKSLRLTCPKCGRICCNRTALNDHISANCSREPQYPCNVCSKRFFSASTLNQHLSIHTGALPHKCSYCDKRFRTRGQVTVHHRTHTGERPFECQVCGQRFTHRETLISHLSRHIGMKRYKCYGCNQTFACISGLKTHRQVRASSCGQVKLNTRAIGPRVRVIKGNVVFEAQPQINPYLRTEDPEEVWTENSSS